MNPPSLPSHRQALDETCQYVKGVGPARHELLQKLGIQTIRDLLYFFPRAYEDLSDQRAVRDLTEDGTIQTVVGEIVEMDGRTTRSGKSVLSVVIHDGQDILEGVWFNQTFILRQLEYGMKVAFSGKPAWRSEHWQMNKPRVRPVNEEMIREQRQLLPVYPLTAGLHAEAMRKIQKNVVTEHAAQCEEVLPQALRERFDLIGLEQALVQMHLPKLQRDVDQARRRLVFEEFLILQLALAIKGRDQQITLTAPALVVTEAIDERIRRLFPFALTRDQNRAIRDICRDLARDRPMKRLLQADVGAGKTAVAVYAMLLSVACKHQAVLMAPTEVLARQHWRTMNQYLAQSRVRRSLLTGSLSPKERRITLGEIRSGNVDLVVGTQALIQNDVEFSRLGLVVIDEQHRFGVLQRAQVKQLGASPHYLVMTATPIPRTIALTVFSDLDISVIKELPPGRQPVVTRWLNPDRRPKLLSHLAKELRQGRQLYHVCPLIEGAEEQDQRAAEKVFEELKQGPLAEFRIGLLHGRLDDAVKDDVMKRFHQHELDVLVTTTVVEVGVDVPNATLMVIEQAERFGLSQLHQLRGRISRGAIAGECYLFSMSDSDETKQRLKLFVKTTDGFELAEMDLKLRGMGEFFGTRQHGLSELRIGNPLRDAELLSLTQQVARQIVQDDPALRLPEHQALRRELLRKYGRTLDLVEIA